MLAHSIMPALLRPVNSLPALGLQGEANGVCILLGSLKSLEKGGGAWSATANAPVSSGPLRLPGTVVSANVDVRAGEPSGIETHKPGREALPSCGRCTCHGQGHRRRQLCWRAKERPWLQQLMC